MSSSASNTCVLCGGANPKYRCVVCRSPTDCLSCYKSHAETHNEAETLAAAAATSAALQAPSTSTSTSTGTGSEPKAPHASRPDHAASTSQDPLRSFAESSELQQLLKDHPDLREKLRIIHTAIRDAESAPGREYSARGRAQSRGRGRGRGQGRKTPWQRPDDLERGMRALHGARLNEGRDGGPLQQFAKLVNERNAASKRDLANDDTALG